VLEIFEERFLLLLRELLVSSFGFDRFDRVLFLEIILDGFLGFVAVYARAVLLG
jgi:hypothetical protein